MTQDEKNVRDLLAEYERLLNAADAESIAPLYTEDGIFMPQGLPTAAGREQVLDSYRAIFRDIALTIEFAVDEVLVGDGVATALTRSSGSVRVLATGAEAAEANREVFVFVQEEGTWRIARYMFNKAA